MYCGSAPSPAHTDHFARADVALRFSCRVGNSAEFWLNAQRAVDLWDATQALGDDMLRIKPLRVA